MAQADQKQVDSEVSFVDFLQMSGFPPPPPNHSTLTIRTGGRWGGGLITCKNINLVWLIALK